MGREVTLRYTATCELTITLGEDGFAECATVDDALAIERDAFGQEPHFYFQMYDTTTTVEVAEGTAGDGAADVR